MIFGCKVEVVFGFVIEYGNVYVCGFGKVEVQDQIRVYIVE